MVLPTPETHPHLNWREAEELDLIDPDALKQGADAYDRLLAGDFYEKEAAAVEYMRNFKNPNDRK